MALRLILVHHGRTHWNTQQKIQGHTGSCLDRVGKKQARQLGTQLIAQGMRIDKVISSDLFRAVQTAQSICTMLHTNFEQDERIRECGFGTLEGVTHKQAIDTYGKEILPHLQNREHPYNFRPFGGENRKEVLERHIDFLRDFYDRAANATILVVGHERSLNTLLGAMWSSVPPIENPGEFRIVEV